MQESHGVWWNKKARGERHPHEILDKLFKQIEDDQQSRYAGYKEYQRHFTTGNEEFGDDVLGAILSARLSQNELANTIETLWAQVFKNNIVPAVACSEADYDEWQRAKSYGRWLEGVLDDSGAYDEAFPKAGLDALVFGTGAIRVYSEEDEDDPDLYHIKCERVSPRYLMTDKLESKDGRPKSFFRKHNIDRWTLLSLYETSEDGYYGTAEERISGILDATSNDDQDLGYSNVMRADMISVKEAWHLPTRPGKNDGRHVIWIKGCTLVDEPCSFLPFVFIRFGNMLDGFWGDSAVRRIIPTQKLLDKLNQKIDESQDVMGVPRIIMQKGNGVRKSDIDDIPGGILEADNINGIKDWNAQCVTPELYQDRDAAPKKMRSLLGVSDFEVQQQIPQGMRDVSGAFLERWVDQGQARHAMFHKQYEQAVVALSYIMMREAERLQELGCDVVVSAPGDRKTSIEELSFKDVRVERKRMKLVVQPMNQLPQTFAGKVEAIGKLRTDAGVQLDSRTALRMLQVPDLNMSDDMLSSSEEVIMKNLNWMVKKGEYLPPLPFDDLDLIVKLATQFINAYRIRKNADLEKVSLIAKYIEDAIALKGGLPDESMPPEMGAPPGPPGAMAPPPGPPPGPGMPPPNMGPPPGAPPGPPGAAPMGPPGPMPQMPPPQM
jgi:hypothetical protein